MDLINTPISAIDIGTTKIVAITGKINAKGRLEIMGLSKVNSTGIKRGVILNIEDTVNAITKVINDVQESSGHQVMNVFAGIAGQHIRSIRNRGYINHDSYDHEITKEDTEALIKDMYKIPIDVGEEIIHVVPQNYIVDSETGIKNPIGMSGKRLEANFHIVIGQVASIKNIEKCVNRVHLKINDLILEPIASATAVLTEDEKEAGVALIDIGGGTTDIAIYYENIIRHTAVIPFGGNVVTNDIKEGCAILQRQAEALKLQYGSSLGDIASEDKVVTIPGISGREPKEISFKNLAYIIQSRMEEIIDAITFEIENSGFWDKLSAGIVITGGGALLKDLSHLFKYQTGLDVRIGYPSEYLSGEYKKEWNNPMYATSIGLLLEGWNYMEKENVSGEAAGQKTNKDKRINRKKPNEKSKPKIFDSLKRTLNDIFDEDDTGM